MVEQWVLYTGITSGYCQFSRLCCYIDIVKNILDIGEEFAPLYCMTEKGLCGFLIKGLGLTLSGY